MTSEHRCKRTDHISKIAAKHGFRKWETVWEENKDRLDRSDPNVLFKGGTLVIGGDVLRIPDLTEETALGDTDADHLFVLFRDPLMLRFRILGDDFKPVANADFELEIPGLPTETGKTDDKGEFDAGILVTTTAVKLSIRVPPEGDGPDSGAAPVRGDAPVTWDLKVGALNPILENAPDQNCISGVQQRLNNLNFNTGPVDGILGPNTRAAIRAFQDFWGIHKAPGSEGVPDPGQTQQTLFDVHDSEAGKDPPSAEGESEGGGA